MRPPRHSLGRRVRASLFATPWDAAVTLAVGAVLVFTVPGLLRWALIDAVWLGETKAVCREGGACWAFVTARWRQMLAGFYPEQELWRVGAAAALLAAATAPVAAPRPGRWLWLTPLGVTGAFAVLSGAGLSGLPDVAPEAWGGFFLNVLVGASAILLALPFGILLALGRGSRLPVVKGLCVGFIELVRSVPLITLLFMASYVLPLLVPAGTELDRLTRALVVVTLFSAAYMAEAVRGGLQAVGGGQREAARALGLGSVRTVALVVLPQALRVSIPALVNTFIGVFKDTTLLYVIGLFDVMWIARAALSDFAWQGRELEAYAFVGLVFFAACFALSRWSAALERRLDAAPLGLAAAVKEPA
ncbi:MAG: amino acid ABC transporter permease [Proteobacteria bacterium]|nr:amino acid ABC transporter permease [Pseudomonadota bacterium]